jgi:prevent-host-death family protein
MAKISVSEAREDFSEVVNQVCYTGERMILHRRGKDLVALVPVSDLEMLESLEDAMDTEAAKAAIKESKKKGSISWSKLKKELGLK